MSSPPLFPTVPASTPLHFFLFLPSPPLSLFFLYGPFSQEPLLGAETIAQLLRVLASGKALGSTPAPHKLGLAVCIFNPSIQKAKAEGSGVQGWGWRAGPMAKSTCCCSLSEALSSVPSAHIRQIPTTCNSSSRGLDNLLGPPGAPSHTHTHADPPPHTHTHITEINESGWRDGSVVKCA